MSHYRLLSELAGLRGQALSGELERSNFAIMCLTPENLTSSWLLFEAGALSKHSDSRVCTYLLDLKPTDVKDPLSQFQHTIANEEQTKQLVTNINTKLAEGQLEPDRLDRTFVRCWPDLRNRLQNIPPPTPDSAKPEDPMAKVPEMITEILERIREQARTTSQRQEPKLVMVDQVVVFFLMPPDPQTVATTQEFLSLMTKASIISASTGSTDPTAVEYTLFPPIAAPDLEAKARNWSALTHLHLPGDNRVRKFEMRQIELSRKP
jgi:hypothetical protein